MDKKLRRQASTVLWSIMLVVSMGAVAFGTASADHHQDDIWPGMPEGTTFQNYTMYLYGDDATRQPGAQGQSIWYEIVVHGLPEDERRAWLNASVSSSPWASTCELQNLNGFFIDRGPNPDNGTGGQGYQQAQYTGEGYENQIKAVDTEYDLQWSGEEGVEAYLRYLGKETDADETHWEFPLSSNGQDGNYIFTSYTKFWDRDQATETGETSENYNSEGGARNTFEYQNGDRVIVDYSNCYTNPPEAGWYRQTSSSETYWYDERGTAPDNQRDGAPEGQNWAPVTFSHWVYICDCDSYDAAVQTIGEPPAMNGTKVENPDEFKGYYTDVAEPTATPTEQATDTPTETTQQETTTQEMTTTTEEMTTTTEEMTTTEEETTAAATTTQEQTGGGGPGFGMVVALVALIGAALLALRRRD